MRLAKIFAALLLFSATTASAQAPEIFDMEGKGDQLPSTDEYNNLPKGLLLSQEQAQEVAKETGQDPSTIVATERKVNYDKIMEMYKEGKFDDVAKNLKPLSEGGHHGAEELMGIMYRLGQGVKADQLKAFDLLNKAAEANRPLAQHHLGTMYYTGEGVPAADPVTALMWLHIAIVHYADGPEKKSAMESRDNIYTQLTRREKDRAMEMARSWLTKKGEAHLLDLQ
ncbi:MAG TPA: hypothetical protein VEF76_13395 [Patescibacteria group bacterium]|nr:hypothetical protein [Patescibacteria group bacterium]